MEEAFWQYYQEEHLEQMRQQTDPPADKVIKQLFGQGEVSTFREVMAKLTHNRDISSSLSELPENVSQYFREIGQLPLWADKQKIRRGQHFFARNAQNILSMLGFLSLPYCYAAANGAQVLYFSERIYKNTQRRLIETAQFVLDVTEENAFSAEGKAFASIAKVRLMHATVRYHLWQSGEWQAKWGQPINQEDMAGTNLAFSWIVIRGLRRIGVKVSPQEAQDFLHLWNVVGYLLGVKEALLPKSPKAAFWLDKQIAKRQFKPSKAGKVLSQALLNCLQASPISENLPKGFVPSYLRFLLGENIADLLAIPPENWTNNLLLINRLRNTFFSPNGQDYQTIRKNLSAELQAESVAFSIPLSLRS